MSDNKIILDTDEEAASVKTVTGWVSSTGRYWGEDEHMARFDGSTHKACECGEIISRSDYCHPCHLKKEQEKYNSFVVVEWDKESPICEYSGDQYFFDHESLCDYLSDSEIHVSALNLVLCEPHPIQQIDSDYFSDDQHEDFELPDDIQTALDSLNKVIQESAPVTFYPSKVAVKVSDLL